jgi:hypothetical protein
MLRKKHKLSKKCVGVFRKQQPEGAEKNCIKNEGYPSNHLPTNVV